jgi:hypothetical protein
MGFQVLTAMNMKIAVFWHVAPCSLVTLTTFQKSVHHHHHWLDSPTWALAFLRSFCQLKYAAIASSDFVTRVFSRLGL